MRSRLPTGTWVGLDGGELYQITGDIIGEGGGSLIYPAVRLHRTETGYVAGKARFALKECFPSSKKHPFLRADSGEIRPADASIEAQTYLTNASRMQMNEKNVTEDIYVSAFRMLPINSGATQVRLSFNEGESFHTVSNTMTVMELLSDKGSALKKLMLEQRCLTPIQSFRVVEQVLFAVREVHLAGYLHLDIQDGNVFIKGSLSDKSDLATLIDFGCARKRLSDGLCATIADRTIFSTDGFSAPELLTKNDGTLRLGVETDLYSVTYLLLLLLTGKKKTLPQLKAAQGKGILLPRELKKMKIPKHLTERVQRILSRGLAFEPEERFHSAEEMRQEVSELSKALQPYRSDLASVEYDAFICYRHGTLDNAVAQLLQKKLEHFKLPVQAKGEEGRLPKLKRVFVDRGELSSCADMEQEINHALDNAGWMIVVCSKQTKESVWVNKEIEYFLEHHDRSRVLAVLLEGEPVDVFPSQLMTGGMVLAADARAQTEKEVLKKLKGDALLTIAAPMLGVPFETLKQRKKLYLMKQIAAVSAFGLVLAMSFGIYAFCQAQAIKRQLESTLINQSRYLSQVSADLLSEGDRTAAIQVALEALPKSEKDKSRPFVSEAYCALNHAVYAYHNPAMNEFLPEYTIKGEGGVSGNEIIISPNHQQVMLLNQSGQLFLFDLQKQRQEAMLEVTDILPDSSQKEFFGGFYIDDDTLFLLTEKDAICWNQKDNRILWRWRYVWTKKSIDAIAISPTKDYIVFGTDNKLIFLSLDTGKLINEYSLNIEQAIKSFSKEVFQVKVSEDGKQVAISVGSIIRAEKLLLFDVETETLSELELNQAFIYGFQFVGTEGLLVSTAEKLNYYFPDIPPYQLEYINTREKKVVWRRETQVDTQGLTYNTFGINLDFWAFPVQVENSPAIAIVIYNQLEILDSESGELLQTLSNSSKILNMASYDAERIFLVLADGTLMQYVIDSKMYSTIGTLSGELRAALYLPEECRFVVLRENFVEITVLSNQIQDPEFHLIDWFDSDISYVGDSVVGDSVVSGEVLRTIISSKGDDYDNESLSLWKPQSDTLLSQTDYAGDKTLIGIEEINNRVTACYLQTKTNGEQTVCGLDIYSGDKPFSYKLPKMESEYSLYDRWKLDGEFEATALFENDGYDESAVCLVKMDTGEIQKYPLTTSGTIRKAVISPKTGAIVAAVEDEDNLYIRRLNLKNGQWRDIACFNGEPIFVESYTDYPLDSIGFTPKGQLVLSLDGYLTIVDLKTEQIAYKTQLACHEEAEYCFLNDDTILFWGDHQRLTTWSLSQEKVLMQTAQSTRSVALIYSYDDGIVQIIEEEGFYNYTSLYEFDSDGRFSKLFECRNGFISYAGQEVLYSYEFEDGFGWYKIYTLDELIAKAEKILDGQTLSDVEKQNYFIQ